MTEQMFTKETIATGTDTHATTPPTFPTVGLVGAAGSRQALESFFRTLPDDSGMAFVVVTRLAAKHNQQLSAALEARTDMPVMIAADGAPIQADHVYIAPPGVELTLEQGQFRLQNLDRTAAQGPLDTFLATLATDQGDNAVAVLLSGMGEDGIAGLQQINAQGGMILVQDPDDAAHAALPRRGVALEGVARIGAASELAQYLVQSKGDLANLPLVVNEKQDDSLNQIFAAILLEILKQTGHDLSHYKPSTLHRRILRRMGMAGSSSLPQYLELLQANLDETTALFRDCLVSVTSFFRDSDAYEMLERDCIPQLFLHKGRSDFVRVWVAGCATGEEAYSVAIQLAERAAQVNEPPRLQVFATDIDEDAIAIARRGLYSPAVAKDIAPARLQRYFVEENGCYRVKPELRELVLFAVHDLFKDPPFSRLDLICCRNVLIYFNREAQEKVFTIFHYALNPNSYLFLGTSESADTAQDLFGVFNKHCHLYQRRDVIMAPQRRLGTSTPAPPAALSGKANERLAQRQTDRPRTVEEMYTAWSLRVHTPPRLLINENYDITHLFGGADRYFQERDGAITQNVLQKILPDLRLDLRAALYQAFNKRERTISRLLRVELPNQSQMLQLHVGPVMEPGFPQEYVEVVFVVQDDAALLGLSATGGALETDLSLVARMEEELLRTRERLQTIIEEYEISGQELKASNEELQSINEELKSTTEELETSKEELQSMNEELITVNSELTRKIDELHRANSDLLNLVSSTDVGAIFLSNTLHLKRFTPRATDLFNLIESDIGRPFAHVTHRLRHTGLPYLAAHVNTTHERIEETVQRDDDRWYILRLFPYRTVSGEVDGVVITLVDINDLKRAESEERQRRQQQSLAELSRQALTGSDLDTLLTAAAHRVAEVLEMELCKVLELQPDGTTLLLKAGVGWHEGLVGQTTVPADTTSQAGYTLQSHAPVIVRDLQTETRFRTPALLTEHDVRSGMGVMIPALDGAYGVLSVHSRQLHTFATYDVDYLQSVANLLAAAIVRRRAETALRAEEQRYRFIFESVGVSLWEEDFTGVKALIDQITAQGVSDLRAHLTAHPEIIAQAIAAVKIRDVNQHTLTLFGAESKEQLLISLDRIFTPETVTAFLEEMITLAEGRQYYATETILQTLQGEQRHVILTVTFPATTDELQRVVVSILDISDRKAAEAALRESEERFRIMANSAPVLIWVSGLDQGYTFFNKAWLEFTGRTMGQELGDGWMQGIHPDDHDRCLSTYTTAFAAHQDFVIEYRLRYHDGSYRWVLDKGTPRLAPDGSFAGFIGGCIDIDDRKAAEVLLTRYQLLSDQARDLILFMRLDGQIVEANNAAAEAYGYDRTSLLRMKIHDLRVPATLSTVASQIAQANQAEDGRGVRFETIHRRRDGSTFPVEVSSIGANVGGERLLMSVIRDISERKAAEAALAASEAKFATAFSLSPLILTITSLNDGRLIEVNESFVHTTGYTRAEALGRTPDELGLWVNPQERTAGLARLAAGETVENVEALFRMKRGELRTCLLGATIVEINGQLCALTALTDITERKATEAALRQSEERFVTIFRRSPYPIAILSLGDGCYVDVNPTWERDTGYTYAEVVGRKPVDLGLQAEPPLRLIEQLQDQGAIRDVEIQTRMRNGQRRTALMSAELIQLNGEPHALLVFTDITERKAAEAALQASETQLRLVTDNITGLTSYVDREECYRFVNAAYERWFAKSRAQIVGLSVREAVGDLAYAQVQPYIVRALAGERVRFENTLAYADGVHRTVMATYVPDVDADGQVQGFYALVTDITERKQAEERLRFLAEASTMLASSLDYTVTLENVAHAAVPGVADWCAIDLVNEEGSFEDGIIAHVDPAKVRWAEDLRTRYPIDPNAPAGAPQVIRTGQSEIYPEITDEMLQGVAKNEEELQLLRSVGYRSVMIVPLKTHGRILGAITFVATETERHFDATDLTMAEELAQRAASAIGNAQLHRAVQQREQQLRISEERLRLVTEAGNIGFYDHDLITQRTTFSDIYREITGVKPDEQLTREMWLARVYPEDCAMVAEKLERAVTYGESYNYEYRIYRPDGELRWLGINSRVLVNEEGRAVRLIGALNDITERKQAEEEIQRLNRDLKRNLVELQALLDVAPIGIFVAHDPACQVITSNAVGAQMLGIQPRENASKSAPHGDELPFRVLRNGRELTPDELPMQYAVTHDMPIYNWDVDVIRADGRVVHLYEYAIPLHDEENNVRGCLGIFVDITERKQAEEALRESEERFRSTFEQAAVGMAHLAIDGRYLRVNDRLCEILGYSREELLQKSFIDVTHPADLAADLAQMERQLAGEIVHHSMEKRYIRKDGATVWANMTASVVRDDTGTPKYGIVVIEEISARKAAEEEKARLAMQIATEQERLAVILEHLPAGVLIAEATGELILSNPEVARIFKHPFRATPDIAGYRTWQLFDPKTGEEYPSERMPMVRTLTTGETVIGEEMKILRGDGTWGYASVNSAPVRDGDGHILMGVAAFIDTTARRQAEEELRRLNMTLEQRVAERTAELERSNQELDQFAYVASHDLKAPLRAIINLAGWIDEDAGALLPAPSLEHLQKLRGRALRMERLLDDLLTYSRIGRRDGVFEEIKTEALVQDAIYLLAPPPGFTVKVDGDLPVLLAPRTPLDLVFRNLISNAIKHHHQPAQGVIWIQARDLGDFVEFRIHDNGPGIEPQYHERIFGMFQTLRPRDEVEGSGMGLAIAKRAVEYRGGVIRVESAVGQGTIFCFTWPKKAVPNDTDSRE